MERSNARALLPLITSAHLANDFYMMILPPLLPLLMPLLKLSYFLAGTLISLMLGASFVASPLVGYLADARRCRRSILSLGFLMYGLGLLLLGLINTTLELALICILLGVAQAAYHPQAVTLISASSRGSKGKALGIHGVGGSLGHFIAPLAVGYLFSVADLRNGLAFLGLLSILIGAALRLALKEPRVFKAGKLAKTFTLNLILLTAVSSLRDVVYRSFTSFLPSFFVAQGRTLLAAGALTSLMLVVGIVAQPLGGWLSDKFGRKVTFNASLAVLTLSLLGFSAFEGAWRLAFLPLIGLGVFFTFPVALIYASELAGGGGAGASVGFMFGTSQLIASTGPALMGWTIDAYGFEASFHLMVGAALAAFVLSLTLPKRPAAG